MAYVQVYASPHGEGTWMNHNPDGPDPNWRIKAATIADPFSTRPYIDAEQRGDRDAVQQITQLEWLRRQILVDEYF